MKTGEPPKPPSSSPSSSAHTADDDEITASGMTEANRASLTRSLRAHIQNVIALLNECLAALDAKSPVGLPAEKGLVRKLTRANMSIRFIDKAAAALLSQFKPPTSKL